MRPFLPLVPILLMALPTRAEEDYFAFIPEGGRMILQAGLTADPSLSDEVATARSAGDWLALMSGAGLPGLAGLDDWQRQTLADYLAYAGPVDPADLPPDGRDMTLDRCQSCHIVTVVVTQARTREAWLGTLGKPSHVEIPLSPAEREQLADYLAVNAGIPIDAIPEELRAGGASY